MSEVYQKGVYRDPADLCDTLRELDKKTDNCCGCAHDGGTAWGVQVCDIGKGPDSDGYCRYWKEKVA